MKLSLFFVIILLSFSTSSFALEPIQGRGTFSFDTGYFSPPLGEHHQSITNFNLEVLNGLGALSDQTLKIDAFKNSWWGRGLYFIEVSAFSFLYDEMFITPYHEFGHISRRRAVGQRPYLLVQTNDNPFTLDEKGKKENYFDYLLNFYLKNSYKDIVVRERGRIFDLANPPSGWDTVIDLAGTNNTTYLIENIERSNYLYGNGHLISFWAYFLKKSAHKDYIESQEANSNGTLGDFTTPITYWGQRGFNITADDIKSSSEMTMLLSGTFYSNLYGVYNFFRTGDPKVKTFEIAGFRLPDTNMYNVRDGYTYKFDSGYRLSDKIVIPFSYERIMKGKSGEQEFTVGGFIRESKFEFLPNLIFGRSLSANLTTNYFYSNELMTSVGLEYWHVNSFQGERQIRTLKDGENDYSAWARVSYIY
jgi:hypothetical protein